MTAPTHSTRSIILLTIALITTLALGVYWYQTNQYTDQRDWDANRQNLPDIDVLQQRIQTNLFGDNSAEIDSVGTDTDQIMDPQAMEAKLAGSVSYTHLTLPTTERV